jgi:hypothetical protein
MLSNCSRRLSRRVSPERYVELHCLLSEHKAWKAENNMHSGSTVSRTVESERLAHAGGVHNGRIGSGRTHRLLHTFDGAASTQDRLLHWRDQYRQIMETIENGLPLHSIARPVLEEDLGVAAAMVAQLEAQAAEEQSKLG